MENPNGRSNVMLMLAVAVSTIYCGNPVVVATMGRHTPLIMDERKIDDHIFLLTNSLFFHKFFYFRGKGTRHLKNLALDNHWFAQKGSGPRAVRSGISLAD
jgi:hypothetical protein